MEELYKQIEFLTAEIIVLRKKLNSLSNIYGISGPLSDGSVVVTEPGATINSNIQITPLGNATDIGILRNNGSFEIRSSAPDGKLFMWTLTN